ncbi:hypothetical protein MDAP_000103 [Mitosporidium daphniae]
MTTHSPFQVNSSFLRPKYTQFTNNFNEAYYFVSEAKALPLFEEAPNIAPFEEINIKGIFTYTPPEGYRLLLVLFGLLSLFTLTYSIFRIVQLVRSCPASYKINPLTTDQKMKSNALQSSLC